MTFPASDAPAPGHTTGTEPPARPIDRKAPIITREQIEAAANAGHAADKAGGSKQESAPAVETILVRLARQKRERAAQGDAAL